MFPAWNWLSFCIVSVMSVPMMSRDDVFCWFCKGVIWLIWMVFCSFAMVCRCILMGLVGCFLVRRCLVFSGCGNTGNSVIFLLSTSFFG